MRIARTKSELYYLAGYICILVRILCENSNLIPINETVKVIFTLFFATFMMLAIAEERLTIRQWIVVLALGGVVVLSYLKMKYFFFLMSYFCVISIKQVDLKRVIFCSFCLKSAYLFVHIVIYVSAYLINPEIIDYTYRYGQARHYFFISHANTFSMYLLWTIFECIYLYQRLKVAHLLLILALDLGIDFFTDSNSNRILILLAISLFCYAKKHPQWNARSLRILVKYGFSLFSIFFCTATALYQYMGGWMKAAYLMLDALFTGRLVLGAYAYHVGGVTFLGQLLPDSLSAYWDGRWVSQITCENTYIWMMVSSGIFYLILFSLLFYVSADRMTNLELILSFLYIVYAIMETYPINFVLCFSPLIAGQYVMGMNRNDQRESLINFWKLRDHGGQRWST